MDYFLSIIITGYTLLIVVTIIHVFFPKNLKWLQLNGKNKKWKFLSLIFLPYLISTLIFGSINLWASIWINLGVFFNILVIYIILKSVKNLHQSNTLLHKKFNELFPISAVLFTILAPFTGFMRYKGFEEFPFADKHILTLIFLVATSVICFWSSKLFKKYLSPLGNVLVLVGILQGLILNIALCIHFGIWIFNGLLFPIVGYELVAPVVNIFLLLTELYHNHLSFVENHQQKKNTSNNFIICFLHQSLGQKSIILFILLLPFYFVQQVILILFGQSPDAVIRVFVESCKFTFSDNTYCPPPASHYLCSVAAHGNPKLVQPIRQGYRGGQKIIINRQLLIANAFEHYLEEKYPKLHKKLRIFYDSLKIPVDKWAKNSFLANLFYILMKPLEWFFLIFLYFFDKKPENRIALQYLMPDEKLRELKAEYIK